MPTHLTGSLGLKLKNDSSKNYVQLSTAARGLRISIQYPSGSVTNANPFILPVHGITINYNKDNLSIAIPPSGFLMKFTPNFSNRSQALYTSGTDIPICPSEK